MAQLFDAPMVGCCGPNLGNAHYFLPIDKKFGPKITTVPKMEKGHVQTDMTGVQSAVLGKFAKDPVQVRDIVDVIPVSQNLGFTLLRSRTSMISLWS